MLSLTGVRSEARSAALPSDWPATLSAIELAKYSNQSRFWRIMTLVTNHGFVNLPAALPEGTQIRPIPQFTLALRT